jgi:hypothetical protein
MKNIISTIFFLFIAAISLYAQSPQSFNYQAVAHDNLGNVLVNQNIAVRISILDGSIVGTAQYVETQNPQTNQFGLFALEIGKGTIVSGTFANTTWENGAKFIKIEMDANNGTSYALVGTSQLLSVPYALYAGNGSQWTEYGNHIYFDKTVGIGDISIFSANISNQQGSGLYVVGKDIPGSDMPVTFIGDVRGQIFGTETNGRIIRIQQTTDVAGNWYDLVFVKK